MKLPGSFRRSDSTLHIRHKFVSALWTLDRHFFLQHRYCQRSVLSCGYAKGFLRLPGSTFRTPQLKLRGVFSWTDSVFVGQDSFNGQRAPNVGMCWLYKQTPANRGPCILHGVERTGLPIPPESPNTFPSKCVVQHPREVVAAYVWICTNCIETHEPMPGHCCLTFFQ